MPLGAVVSLSKTKICAKGYSASIRPPVAYTQALKRKQIKEQHLPGGVKDYEEDHFIPLSIGGAPRNPKNLWPELWVLADKSDELEFKLYKEVCWPTGSHGGEYGEKSLRQAQKEIAAYKSQNG